MGSLTEYLKPTCLCDFDEVPEIRATAQRLTMNLPDIGQVVQTIYRHVKEFPYGLEDWNIKASETLRKG